jgi:hypothetical protein
VWPRSESTCAPEFASQIRTVPSLPPVAIFVPSGAYAIECTSPVCPDIVKSWLPVRASQTRAVASLPAVAMRSPSGLKAAALTPQA